MKQPKLRCTETAEFVGAMLGDGSIGEYSCKKGDGGFNTQRVVKFTISKDEECYAEHLKSLFQDLFGSELVRYDRKNENAMDLRCFQKDISDL